MTDLWQLQVRISYSNPAPVLLPDEALLYYGYVPAAAGSLASTLKTSGGLLPLCAADHPGWDANARPGKIDYKRAGKLRDAHPCISMPCGINFVSLATLSTMGTAQKMKTLWTLVKCFTGYAATPC